jgi:hypothetical protein
LLIALAIVMGIAFVGLSFLGAASSGRPRERIEPEDVIELHVYFICRAQSGT